jgi:hypothetical protein
VVHAFQTTSPGYRLIQVYGAQALKLERVDNAIESVTDDPQKAVEACPTNRKQSVYIHGFRSA